MQKVLKFISNELKEAALPACFFLAVFYLVVITKKLMLEQYHIEYSGFVAATVGALVVAKALLLSDNIRFINKFPDKPLIYNVVWKTVIYGIATLIVQFGEEFVPICWKYRSVTIAFERGWDEIIWPHFWAVHILLVFFLSLYVSLRELARVLGEAEFIKIFLGIDISKNKASIK